MPRGTKTQDVLKELWDLGWHRGAILDPITWRFGGAIGSLRDAGWDIASRVYDDETGENEYRLLSHQQGPPREPSVQIRLTLPQARWLNGFVKSSELLGMPWFKGISGKIGAALDNAEREWERRQKKGKKQ